MKLLLITPGTGHFYCGSCLRDQALARALRERGHDVTVVPLYLPLVTEHTAEECAVRMGGINMYLQQKSRLAARLPRWFANLLDSPKLLRWASKRGSMTDPEALGAMTVSMLRGEEGNQAAEVEKLAAWFGGEPAPDAVVLSNAMLTGVVRRLKAVHDVPVIVTLQGEAPFLDALAPRDSEAAWSTLRERADDVDAFVPVSHWYGGLMRERLGLGETRVTVVHNGLDLSDLSAEPRPRSERRPVTIGYLARMCRDKGLPTLVRAFVELARRSPIEDLRLVVAGVMLPEDRPLVEELRAEIAAAGLSAAVEFRPNLVRADKLAFLAELSVLSVPATYGESFGLYVLEALAAGVPVVQPRHAAFPEILEATRGGRLCEPDDPASLAGELERVLTDEDEWARMAREGRAAVHERFHAGRMAEEFEAVCRMAGVVRSAEE